MADRKGSVNMDFEAKLEKFSGTVLQDAEKRRDKIEAELAGEKKARIAAKEDEFLAGAYMEIQKNITRIQKEDNEKVLHAELEAKKSLLLKREQIIDEVFKLAVARIEEYVRTPEYKKALAEKIKTALAELGEGNKVVYLTKADSDVFDVSCGAVLETVSEKDFIGGVKAVNTDRNIAVNYSYCELLELERSSFLQKSGLSLS